MSNIKIEFSPSGYRGLIEGIRNHGYDFAPMANAFACNGRLVILRHDVDFSVEYALKMARLESEAGVRSTYFFMITCEHYNIFSPLNREALIEISALGHEIGLHWDSRFLPEQAGQQADFFRAQVRMLSSITGNAVRSASQHIPTDTPAFDISPFIEINAYSKRINDRYSYVSDSSMVWRQHTPLDLVAEGVNIQFLAHPIWWMADGSTQAEKIRSLVKSLHRQSVDCSEAYLVYMQKVLDNREKYDKYFRESQKSN